MTMKWLASERPRIGRPQFDALVLSLVPGPEITKRYELVSGQE